MQLGYDLILDLMLVVILEEYKDPIEDMYHLLKIILLELLN